MKVDVAAIIENAQALGWLKYLPPPATWSGRLRAVLFVISIFVGSAATFAFSRICPSCANKPLEQLVFDAIPQTSCLIYPRWKICKARPHVSTTPSPGYVAYVGAKRSQVEALALFADLQNDHKILLDRSVPDIRAVGQSFELRIGPTRSKSQATNLCTSLISEGQQSCVAVPL